MITVVGVRFKEIGKIYYFDPKDYELSSGTKVIVETARGVECGEIAMTSREVNDEDIVSPLMPIIRIATDADMLNIEENRQREAVAYTFCTERIRAHKLEMKLVNVELAFNRNKMIFFFTADDRVDFRVLVKDLVAEFKTRIELRQIGVRDESKKVGGLGMCGRPFCCATFLGDFQPVSIKMAKEQGVSLSSVKISGTCGRLMCCLKYEQAAYEHLLRTTPRYGNKVTTPSGSGTVVDVSLLTGFLKVRLDKNPDSVPVVVHRDEVKVIKSGFSKPVNNDVAEKKRDDDSKQEPVDVYSDESQNQASKPADQPHNGDAKRPQKRRYDHPRGGKPKPKGEPKQTAPNS